MLKRFVLAASIAATCCAWSRGSAAQPCATITRDNVVSCAAAASLTTRASREAEAAARGGQDAARTVLPSNPVLSLAAGRRATDDGKRAGLGWSASLSQELEIGGQRGARRRAATAELDAQKQRTRLSEREAAALAWGLYFDVLAAESLVLLEKRALRAAEAAGSAARALAEQGLGSGVDADVAGAHALGSKRSLSAAERRARAARAALASAVGLDPRSPIRVTGALEPLSEVEARARRLLAHGDEARPELALVDAERRAHRARADLLRSTRVPNPTLSLFVEKDGFDERYVGAGLAFPLPLPAPVGKRYSGEIAEAEALARKSTLDAARLRRERRLAIVTALGEYASRSDEAKSFEADRLERARRTLDDIATEIEARRLPVRDALLTQQALLELLRSHIETLHGLCKASVELGAVSGFSFGRGGR